VSRTQGITHYDAAGLYRSYSIGFSMGQRGAADPICGSVIPGKVVS
jgi:hypothetical protein